MKRQCMFVAVAQTHSNVCARGMNGYKRLVDAPNIIDFMHANAFENAYI